MGGKIPRRPSTAHSAQATVKDFVGVFCSIGHRRTCATRVEIGQGLMNILRTLAVPLIDFALPPRCPACGVIVSENHRFCLECWAKMDFLGSPCCESCALPFPFEQAGPSHCGACLANPPAHDRARAVLAYGRSEEHTSELHSLMRISYSVFCLNTKIS